MGNEDKNVSVLDIHGSNVDRPLNLYIPKRMLFNDAAGMVNKNVDKMDLMITDNF